MDISEMFPSRFLKSQQLIKKGEATLTIKSVYLEKFDGKQKGKQDTKGVVSFNETPLEWLLNKTNAKSVALMFGDETNKWIGKRVCIWPAPFFNPFTGEQTTAIRVRGSPDLPADKEGVLQIGREVVKITMKKTTPKNGKATAAADLVEHNPETGEVGG